MLAEATSTALGQHEDESSCDGMEAFVKSFIPSLFDSDSDTEDAYYPVSSSPALDSSLELSVREVVKCLIRRLPSMRLRLDSLSSGCSELIFSASAPLFRQTLQLCALCRRRSKAVSAMGLSRTDPPKPVRRAPRAPAACRPFSRTRSTPRLLPTSSRRSARCIASLLVRPSSTTSSTTNFLPSAQRSAIACWCGFSCCYAH